MVEVDASYSIQKNGAVIGSGRKSHRTIHCFATVNFLKFLNSLAPIESCFSCCLQRNIQTSRYFAMLRFDADVSIILHWSMVLCQGELLSKWPSVHISESSVVDGWWLVTSGEVAQFVHRCIKYKAAMPYPGLTHHLSLHTPYPV